MKKIGKAIQLLRSATYWRGIRYGVAAAVEHSRFLGSAQFKTVLDVGANKGQFALAVRASLPFSTIVSFEPLEEEAFLFECIFRGDENARIFRYALGTIDGDSTIYVSGRRDSSSLLKIGNLQSKIFPGTEEVGTRQISVRRLDTIFRGEKFAEPILLKIDVQGFEMEVLKGATSALSLIDGIYVELSFLRLYEGQPLAHEVIDWLTDHGFCLAGVYHIESRKNGVAVQADCYFRRV